MGGEIKVLEFSSGTDVAQAPTNVFIGATGTLTFANDAAYVTAKGSAATFGDFYGNSSTGKLRQYNGTAWVDINSTLNNTTAVVAPTANDDSGDNYSVSSLWLDTVLNEWYLAKDVTVGNAVWTGLVDKSSTQTIAGTKTFSAVTTFSNTTESSSKDTGAVVIEGGLGVEKNAYIGGNVVITGDLTVNGTNTVINTTTLEVEDANIILNNGGAQLSANNIAGLTVEMSDATHVTMIYSSTLASRWKIGDLASEAEIATVSHTQTLTNKTLYDNSVTFVDSDSITRVARFDCGSITAGQTRIVTFPDSDGTLVYLALAQSLTNKSLDDTTTLFFDTASPTKQARLECSSVTAGQTRVITVPDFDLTLVGTSTTQTLTNKLLDGGTASASNLWKLPGDTLANLQALGRVEKAIYYDETNNRIVFDDGATLTPVGSGGAGGGIALVWRNDGAVIETTRYNQLCYDFEAGDTQYVYTSFKVPTGYTTGKQITLKLKIASPTGSGNALITATSTLIRNGVDALSVTTNQRTSTNSAQTISSANFEYEITLDIVSNTGQINSVNISPGDTILIAVTRGTDTNVDVVYFMPTNAEVYVTP